MISHEDLWSTGHAHPITVRRLLPQITSLLLTITSAKDFHLWMLEQLHFCPVPAKHIYQARLSHHKYIRRKRYSRAVQGTDLDKHPYRSGDA